MPIPGYPLSRSQLAQLVKECDERFQWLLIRDFCNQVYGPARVHKVETTSRSEYNDEDGYDKYLDSLKAYDFAGKEVGFDLNQPFWRIEEQRFKDLQEKQFPGGLCPTCHQVVDPDLYKEDIQDAAYELLQDFSFSGDELKKKAAQNKWLEWSDLPTEDATYNLMREPDIHFSITPGGILPPGLSMPRFPL